MLQIIFSKMFAQRTALDDRGSVSLCSTGLVCLLFRITKITCSPSKDWQACLQPITKDWGFLTLGPLSCNILYCMWRCHLALFAHTVGTEAWEPAEENDDVLVTTIATSIKLFSTPGASYLLPASINVSWGNLSTLRVSKILKPHTSQ